MSQYDEFFDQLAQRLGGRGFSVTMDVASEKYHLKLVATRSAFELRKLGMMTRFIIASVVNPIDADRVKDYSSQVTDYALADRNSLILRAFSAGILSVPVLVSNEVSEGVKTWITGALPEWHYGGYVLPVLISPKERQIYYLKHSPPYIGGGYYPGFRKFVEEELGFG
jgi:hypothetical protein